MVFARQRISAAAAGPDDGVVLAGDGTALWRSTDGGASWKITGPTGINRVVVHPTDNSTSTQSPPDTFIGSQPRAFFGQR